MAIIYYKPMKERSLGLLLPLMIIVCIVETSAQYFKQLGLRSNYDIYKIWSIACLLIQFAVFYKILRLSKQQRRLFLFLATLSCIFMLIDLFYISVGTSMYPTNTMIAIEHFILSCLLLVQLFMNDEAPVKLSVHPYFWFAAGLMLFNVCHLITSGLHPYLRDHKIMLFGDPIYRTIARMANFVLYSFYSISFFLCSRYKATLPQS